MNEYLIGLEHIGIPSSDIYQSIAFYSSLGFSVIQSEIIPETSEHVSFLEKNGLILEIYQSEDINPVKGEGIDHFAIAVSNVEALFKELSSRSYQIIPPGISELPFWDKGIKFFNIKGPDGVIIEFCERLK